MARKTVITKVLGQEAQDGVIEFPQNKTLYADQFTDEAPYSDDERAGFKASNMKDVFEHYQPHKEITLDTENGESSEENFSFKSIKDFEDSQLIAQSEIMSTEQSNINAYNAIIQHLEKNQSLKKAIKDDALRNDLKNALQALLDQIK